MIVRVLIIILSLCLTAGQLTASTVKSFPAKEVKGSGPLPYGYRVIDGHIHAGGHPLNPANKFGNTDQQAMNILKYLKAQGVDTVIDLENSGKIQSRYQRLLDQAGLKRIHIPMHATKVPTKKEWQTIKTVLKGPVYLHCKWGADRTGVIIARYLVEEDNYTAWDAWQAVISGGSHAGPLGGLKKTPNYFYLTGFIWLGPKINGPGH